MSSQVLHGIIPAVLVPFTPEGAVDEPALRAYVEFLIEAGVHGLFPLGTNGEGPLLSVPERQRVAEVVVRQAAGRIPVVLQTGAITTAETVTLSRHAREIGAQGVAVVAPYYFPHDERSLAAHFGAVAEAVPDLPLYLYNIPGNAKNDLKPELVVQLAERYHHVRGVKDSSKDLNRLQDYLQAAPPGFEVLVGTDSLAAPALLMGATGVVSAVGNCFPEIMVRLYDSFRAGRLEAARDLQYTVNALREALKRGPYISPYKLALQLRGLAFGGVRGPLRWPTEVEAAELRSSLARLGLL